MRAQLRETGVSIIYASLNSTFHPNEDFARVDSKVQGGIRRIFYFRDEQSISDQQGHAKNNTGSKIVLWYVSARVLRDHKTCVR